MIWMKVKSKILEKEKNSKSTFIIISKSGNTIETLSNTFLLKVVKKMLKT